MLHTNSWRFWSNLVCSERNITPRERGALCRSLFWIASICTPIRILSQIICTTRFQQLIVFQQAENIARRKQNEAFKHTMDVHIIRKTTWTDTAPKGRKIKCKCKNCEQAENRADNATFVTTQPEVQLQNLVHVYTSWSFYFHQWIWNFWSTNIGNFLHM